MAKKKPRLIDQFRAKPKYKRGNDWASKLRAANPQLMEEIDEIIDEWNAKKLRDKYPWPRTLANDLLKFQDVVSDPQAIVAYMKRRENGTA